MDIEEAETIYAAYAQSFKDLAKGEIVQPSSDLPCSPARIRFALLVLAKHYVDNGVHEQKYYEDLEMKYALLHARFRENADRLNSALRSYSRSEKARAYIKQNGGPESFIPSVEDMGEFHNFIADCMGNYPTRL